MLGVNSDEDRQALKTTILIEPITWRSWWDLGSRNGPIQSLWQVELRPTIHLIDHQGIIRYWNIQPDELDDAIEALVEEANEDIGRP